MLGFIGFTTFPSLRFTVFLPFELHLAQAEPRVLRDVGAAQVLGITWSEGESVGPCSVGFGGNIGLRAQGLGKVMPGFMEAGGEIHKLSYTDPNLYHNYCYPKPKYYWVVGPSGLVAVVAFDVFIRAILGTVVVFFSRSIFTNVFENCALAPHPGFWV